MVARTPPKNRKTMVAPPLSPTLLRETVKKVDQCMARLQELQYTVTGGNKVVAGVKLSPRSTKAYLKTSLRCKQESMRIRNNGSKKSPTGKLPANVTGDWRRMSLSAMFVGETVAEILQASKITTEIMKNSKIDDPKTPLNKKQRPNQEKTPLETRRRREKQHQFRIIRPDSSTPALRKARSKINFKVSPEKRPEIERVNINGSVSGSRSKRYVEKQHQFRVVRGESSTPALRKARSKINFKVSPEKGPSIQRGSNHDDNASSSMRYIANRVSPKHKPWAKKAVLFPNPLFHSSPTSKNQQISKTKSPLIAKKRETPHKFLVKSPVKVKSPAQKGLNNSVSPVTTKTTTLSRKSPPNRPSSMASKLRRSLSPSRLANRFISPLKGRRISMNGSVNFDGLMMNGVKQRPPPLMMMPMRPRTVVGGAN